MAEEQFYTILTNVGKAKIANATLLNSNLTLKTLKVGDGNGTYYNPTEDQEDLKNTVHECAIGAIYIDKKNPNWIISETIIPGSVGGFTIREVGLFDAEGDMIAVGKYPETYKPVVANGASKDLNVRTIFEVSNAENVTLNLDPSVIIATKEDINNLQEQIDENTAQLKEKANPNLLLNGGPEIWQRGTSFTAFGYTADRWIYDISGDDDGIVTKHADGGLQMKLVSNQRIYLMQRLELTKELKSLLANKTVTISFDVSTSAGVNINPYVRIWHPGNGGHETKKAYNENANEVEKRIQCQLDVGDLSADDWLGIDIFRIDDTNKLNLSDNLFIRFKNIKLELGSVATPFIPRPYGEELALCQRYYQKIKFISKVYDSQNLAIGMTFSTTMRTTPTINVKGLNSSDFNTMDKYGSGDCKLTGSLTYYADNFSVYNVVSSVAEFEVGYMYGGILVLDGEIY